MSAEPANAPAGLLDDFYSGPIVTVTYQPPCPTERTEISGGFDGPCPVHVVKSICRSLDLWPGDIRAEPDPRARGKSGAAARCYIVDSAGRPLAHVIGLSFAYVRVSAAGLDSQGWRPGRNRERATQTVTP